MKKYISIEEYLSQSCSTNDKKNYKKIIIILCISTFFFSLYNIFNWILDNSKINNITKEIDKNVDILKSSDKALLVNPVKDKTDDYWYYVKLPLYRVNLDIFKRKNSDTVGFIHMSNINYPIVQTSDNNYYLSHDFYKQKNNAGWIFMDCQNKIDVLDDNTVLYGHGRLDGSLFGLLRKLLSKNEQNKKDNNVIWISTDYENLLFQIFSIYTVDNEGYYLATEFINDESKRLWLDTIKYRNTSLISAPINVDNKILTLSTCLNNFGERIVVHAKLIKKEKK